MITHEIPAIKNDHILVIIETPKESRSKYAYDPDLGVMTLKYILPEGHMFPFDFGFIPHTLGEDGDPLDVLVIMDSPAVNGCLVECRVIGAILATRRRKAKPYGMTVSWLFPWYQKSIKTYTLSATSISTSWSRLPISLYRTMKYGVRNFPR